MSYASPEYVIPPTFRTYSPRWSARRATSTPTRQRRRSSHVLLDDSLLYSPIAYGRPRRRRYRRLVIPEEILDSETHEWESDSLSSDESIDEETYFVPFSDSYVDPVRQAYLEYEEEERRNAELIRQVIERERRRNLPLTRFFEAVNQRPTRRPRILQPVIQQSQREGPLDEFYENIRSQRGGRSPQITSPRTRHRQPIIQRFFEQMNSRTDLPNLQQLYGRIRSGNSPTTRAVPAQSSLQQFFSNINRRPN